MSSTLAVGEEPWQLEFEYEPVNDERWACIVVAAVGAQAEDEECLSLFRSHVASSGTSVTRVITMSDLVSILKKESSSMDTRKKAEQKGEKKGKEKRAEEESESLFSGLSVPPPRFPDVLALISKNATYSDGQCKLPPSLMAYALKYVILQLKNEDCFRRKVSNALRWKRKEAEIKRRLVEKLRGERKTIERYPLGSEDVESEAKEDDTWRRSRFDILSGSPFRDGPFNGPEMYIILSEFYDPLCFAELQKIKVPFRAIIRIEDSKRLSDGAGKSASNTGAKRFELISGLWRELERGFNEEEANSLYKDMALVKYVVPGFPAESPIENRSALIACDLTALVYSVFQLHRLNRAYLEQMKVHKMIESLEPLELSRCKVYNTLCDILVTEDFAAEIFVLYSIIEQVVVGVPETITKTAEYNCGSSHLFLAGPESHAVPHSDPPRKEDLGRVCTEVPAEVEIQESRTTETYLTEVLRGQLENVSKSEDAGRSPVIILYDDLISLRGLTLDQSVLKSDEIFQRFVINATLPKVMRRFPKLTAAHRAHSDFQFFRLWEKSRESEETFRVKVFFSIAMRLIEHTEVFDGRCEDVNSSSEVLKGSSGETEKSESISELKAQQEETLDHYLAEGIANSFYGEIRRDYQKVTSTIISAELRKANAFSELARTKSTLFEDLEVACGACPKMDPDEKPVVQDDLAHLEQLLESYEVSYLNEPNLLIDRKKFEAFVGKHNFYETLEPSRSLQRLEKLYDDYNTVDCTYFSPTNTLFVLGQNDVDFRGVYHSTEKGYIASPLSLRDFVIYVLPESRKWTKEENSRYMQFLQATKETMLAEEERKIHRFKCKTLESMTKCGRKSDRGFEASEQTNGGNKRSRRKTGSEEVKRQSKTGIEREKTKKGEESVAEEVSVTLDDLEELPIKAKQPLPRRRAHRLHGFNFGDVRTQVNVTSTEFHSDDGTLVRLRVERWLYKGSVLTLAVRRMGSKLYLHKWMEGERSRKSLQLRTPSDITVTYDVASERHTTLLCKVTWPSGLIIEPLPLEGRTSFYIKQTYLDVYRKGEDIKSEKFRCQLSNGRVLIFHINGAIDVLCPDGTKYGCYKLTGGEAKKPCPSREARRSHDPAVEVYDILTPQGEFWVRDEHSKCRTLLKTLSILTGVYPKTNETFYRREDGTNWMLWPSGKLVTRYPDGTKITSVPEFEESEIFIESESPEKNSSSDGNANRRQSSAVASRHSGEFGSDWKKQKISFVQDFQTCSERESAGFTVITCSYLLEHPKYATVYCEGDRMQVRMPEKMRLDISPLGNYAVESHNSVLKVGRGCAEFYNLCRHCSKKSISTICLETAVSAQEVLSKTKDLYDQKFVVYNSGHILRKGDEGETSPSSASAEKIYIQSSSGQYRPENCEHHRKCLPLRKCLVLERDLTGIEFISDSTLHRYIGRLPEETYYDLSRSSADNSFLRHSFFEPVYVTGREKYLMKYEEDDDHPRQLRRKDLRPGRDIGSAAVNARSVISSGDSTTNLKMATSGKKLPRAVIARFLGVLQPDPIAIMGQISTVITLYRKRACEVTQTYRNRLEHGKQPPFARYIAKELQLIASTLCRSLALYPHTCTIVPDTEIDVHSICHHANLNDHLVEVNADDLRVDILPQCKRIPKPLRHQGRGCDIPEYSPTEDRVC